MLLEDLSSKNGESEKRDCLYYLAIGNARIKVSKTKTLNSVSDNNLITFQEYNKALRYVRAFLQIEPGNVQVQSLETLIKKKMDRGK